MESFSSGRTATLVCAAIAASVLAYGAMFVPTAHGGGKEKAEFGGKKEKFTCEGAFYGVNWGPESAWCQGDTCGSECAAHTPLVATMEAGNKDLLMTLYVHEYGYYLQYTGDVPRGLVRTTDPLILGLDDDTELELYPLCDISTFLREAFTPEERQVRGGGALKVILADKIATKIRFCGLYEISREQFEQLGSKRLTSVKLFLQPEEEKAKRGRGEKLKSTDDGRKYVEYSNLPSVESSITARAYCLLKAEESHRVTLPLKTAPQTACPDGYLKGTHGCRKTCSENEECGANAVCSNGSCLSKCSVHDDCPGCDICLQSFCASHQLSTLNTTPGLGDSTQAWEYRCGRSRDTWERIDEMVYSCDMGLVDRFTVLFTTGPSGVPLASAILLQKRFTKQLEERTNTNGPSESPRLNKAGCKVYTWADEQEYQNSWGAREVGFLALADCGYTNQGRVDHWAVFASSEEALNAAMHLVHKQK